MIGAALRLQRVFGRAQTLRLQNLLQRRLMIAHGLAALESAVEPLRRGVDHRAPHKGTRRLEARVQVDGRHHRLEAVGHQHGLGPAAVALLPAPEPQILPQPQQAGDRPEVPAADQRCAQPRQVPLFEVREGLVEGLGDQQPENRVPQKLQPLVVRRAGSRLKRKRTVRHCLLEQRAIAECMPQRALKRIQRAVAHRSGSPPVSSLDGPGSRRHPGRGLEQARALRPSQGWLAGRPAGGVDCAGTAGAAPGPGRAPEEEPSPA